MAKRVTNEEFVVRLGKVNPNVLVLGQYQNSNTPILVKCKECGNEWSSRPYNLLNGTGCPQCAITRNAKKKVHSNEWFVDRLAAYNSQIEPLEPYLGYKEKILVRCKECGNEWRVTPGNLLSGKGCPKCGLKKNTKARTKTMESFVLELQNKNPDVEIVGDYSNAKRKTQFRCKKCGYEWSAQPIHVLEGHGCPVCGGSQRKEQEVFVKELQLINPYITVEGLYVNARTKIQCKCTICKHVWMAVPDRLLQGGSCPNCNKRNKTSFPEQAILFYVKKSCPDAQNRHIINDQKMELDIYIPSRQVGIEYDGVYYHQSEQRDKKKYDTCKSLGISLIRVVESARTSDSSADLVFYRKRPFNFESLDEVIESVLGQIECFDEDVNTERDSIKIREQYYTILSETSLAKTYPEVAEEWLYERNGEITPEMISFGCNDSYYWKCKTCGYEWRTSVADRTGGTGCPKCADKRTASKLRMTNDEFLMKLKGINPDIEPLEEYKGSHIPILCRCLVCGNEWTTAPANLLYRKRRGCSVCGRSRKA